MFTPPWPAAPLLYAIVGTQIFAVLICGFGWFVPAIPWTIIGLVWLYMIVWTIALDGVKLWIYSILKRSDIVAQQRVEHPVYQTMLRRFSAARWG